MANVDRVIDGSAKGDGTRLSRSIWLRATEAPRAWLAPNGLSVDGRLLNVAGLALPATVWLLGVLQPPPGGLTPRYLASYTALVALLILVDQTLPRPSSPAAKRVAWLAGELATIYFIVAIQGNITRSALLYMLPASRALLLFSGWNGLVLSLSIWLPFGLYVDQAMGADHIGELPTYLTLMLAPYIVAVVFTRATLRQANDRQHLQILYDQLSRAHAELQRLHQQTRETAVTEERNRLAREIHDSIAHYLTVINLQLEAAEKLDGEQRAQSIEQVRRAHRLTQECLREVRRSVAALRAASLEELSLPRALDKLAHEFTENTGLRVNLRLEATDGVQYSPEVSLALYRVAQEGLTNVQRHARATTVTVQHAVRRGEAVLDVCDDGVGPGPALAENHAGFGLIGLRERVELLGGQLAWGDGAGSGFRLVATIPMAKAP
jgi:signal transduction histidine kinase